MWGASDELWLRKGMLSGGVQVFRGYEETKLQIRSTLYFDFERQECNSFTLFSFFVKIEKNGIEPKIKALQNFNS